MMRMSVELRGIPGTEAALGWAGAHTLVVDRADGFAGGRGLGFNGGELTALAIGGCLCNDLRYAAHALGVVLGELGVRVGVEIGGEPPRVQLAEVTIRCRTADGHAAQAVIDRAVAGSIVRNSVERGFPVRVSRD